MKRYASTYLAALFYALLAACLLVSPAAAQEEATEPATQTGEAVTQHSVTIDGVEVPYTATAATIQLTNRKDEPQASIFYIAYTRDDVEDTAQRPVMFCFNGGPGSSSVWLHMGCFGPRRVAFDDVGHTLGPPYELTDNHRSILDTTDLVFIDPVSTGFSHTEGDTNPAQYHSVTGDIRSVGEFIRLWITQNDRWRSPKFLAGESYGTTRAAGLSQHLLNEGIAISGAILVSAVLDFQTLRFSESNDLPYLLYLPTYTALARYHGKLDDDLADRALPELLDEVETWSREVYGPALMQGRELPDDERAAIVSQLAVYTGLSEDLIDRSNLRIPQYRFSDALLSDESNIIGRFDGRIVGPDLDRATDRSGTGDPSYYRVASGFTASFNDYVRGELAYETDDNYEILAGLNWNFDIARNSYPNISGDLRRAMTENAGLHVFVAAGYYDLATPYHAAEYTLNHAITHPDAVDRLTIGYYESGHMVFTHGESLEKLRSDLLLFFERATAESE